MSAQEALKADGAEASGVRAPGSGSAEPGEGAAETGQERSRSAGAVSARRGPLAGRLSRATATVLALGLLLTAALAFACQEVYEANEGRLLGLRAREVGFVLTAAVPSLQTPLASAAELADSTGGNAQKFRTFIAPYVGVHGEYTSVSLWPLGTRRLAPTVTVGPSPALASLPARAQAFFAQAAHEPKLMSVIGLLNTRRPGLGFEFNAPIAGTGFAVYAETPLPANRRSTHESDSAFDDLNYAAYLGRARAPSALLVTNLRRLPPSGRQATEQVPFGDSYLTLVVTPNGSLGGTFFQSLPWIIAISGVFITLISAFVAERLALGRTRAEQLAGALDRVASENRRMYAEQRGIAQTLQHALLPDALPDIEGLWLSARYVPAGSGVDIGGDWYDVVPAGEGRALLLIGDVSGHGLRAATAMASTRHAALAYAAEVQRPAALLQKLSDFLSATPHEYFATVLCILVDVRAHRLTIASAGHPPPLLLEPGQARFLELEPGAPIGVRSAGGYSELEVTVAPGATVLAFTDGLVERRGEILDVGLERLRAAASGSEIDLEDLVAGLAHDLASGRNNDDTAIMGLRWRA